MALHRHSIFPCLEPLSLHYLTYELWVNPLCFGFVAGTLANVLMASVPIFIGVSPSRQVSNESLLPMLYSEAALSSRLHLVEEQLLLLLLVLAVQLRPSMCNCVCVRLGLIVQGAPRRDWTSTAYKYSGVNQARRWLRGSGDGLSKFVCCLPA